MSQRLKDLHERIKNMEAFKAAELKLPKKERSQAYISDLNETIKSCMVQIGHLQKNGDSIEVINGGAFA